MSLDRTYNERTLDDLAALVASTRKGIGNDWQIPGIRAALLAASRRDGTFTLAKLAHAALTVASDPNARTPQRIAHDGPWWTTEANATPQIRPVADDDCAICGRARHIDVLPDHDYEPRVHRNTTEPARMPDAIKHRLHVPKPAPVEPATKPTPRAPEDVIAEHTKESA